MDPELLVFTVLAVLALLTLMFFGAILSAAEMAFASLSRARINNLAEGGGKRGKRARIVADLYEERFDEVISTVLICNNLVAIAAATLSAALFAAIFALFGEDWEFVGYLLSTLVISVLIIIFTDILPKSFAKEKPEKVAIFSVFYIRFLMAVFWLANQTILRMKNSLSAKMSAEGDEGVEDEAQTLLEQELIFMVEEAETDGIINEDDSALITNAIEFNEVFVGDILTPRVNIACIPGGASVDETAGLFLKNGYSRMPVIGESIDEIRGIVNLRDFLKCMATGLSDAPVTLEDIMTPPVYTVTSAPVTEVLTLLKKEKSHMAIVADEYGGTEGLVTMEDILEELVGEIWDESDEIIEEFLPLGENRHKILGNADIDKMFEYFDMEGDSESNTVCGWIMDVLRRVPEEGDSFEFENLTVTVTKADGRRAEECEVLVAAEGEKITTDEGEKLA
ncbi:MAG: hemolysin family protein [Defluviitaleaceae bacterium]|nr:hemolysin family protein [Defluviitaleaceae bacterium]